MSVLENFTFATNWSPILFTFLLGITLLYLYITGPGRSRVTNSEPVPLNKKIWFVSGMITLYVALGSPFDILGHFMFTFHMISMALAFIVAPPMLLGGMPEWLLAPIGKIPGIHRLKFALNPFVTLVLFNFSFSIYHVPRVLDFVMTNNALHYTYYVWLLITASLMWFPVICPVKAFDTLQGFKKMGYIFANSLGLMPACALIIFAPSPMYGTYTSPELWAIVMSLCIPQGASAASLLEMFPAGAQAIGWMEPLEDQQLGGVIMKLIQEVIYGSILIYVFRQWFRRENPKDREADSMEPTQAYYERLRLQSDPSKS